MLLIDNLTIVTMDEQRRILGDAAIVIDQDKIKAVGDGATLRNDYPDAERLDGGGMVSDGSWGSRPSHDRARPSAKRGHLPALPCAGG